MRKIPIEKWKAKNAEGNDVDESILEIFNVLINTKNPAEMPKGIDNFRLMTRIVKAFDEAKEAGELILDEKDYYFLKSLIEKDIPSIWGSNPNIIKAVDSFLEVKSPEH